MTAISIANHSVFSYKGTLNLTNMSSSDFDISSPYSSTAGVRVLTDGDAQYINVSGSWTDSNGATDWIDKFAGSDTASNYEVNLTQSSSTGSATYSGPTLGSYHTISTTRQFQWTKTNAGSFSWSGTLYVREIADTSNVVSCTVTISLENGTL